VKENSLGKILVTPRSLTREGLDSVRELLPLRHAGFHLVSASPGQTPSQKELLALVGDCVGWLAGIEKISREVLSAAPALRVIARNGVGTDGIDSEAIAEFAVTLTTAAGANSQGVADLALALALTCARQIPWASQRVKSGGWDRELTLEVSEMTVGVVGLGSIGRKVAASFAALGSAVVGHDPFQSDAEIRAVTLDELFQISDIITLHLPAIDGSKPLVSHELLGRTKPSTVLVNTARSALVDDDAVLNALDSGRLMAYAVDAYDTEPPKMSALLRHDRVVATPHLGAFTHLSVARATSMAVSSLLDELGKNVRS